MRCLSRTQIDFLQVVPGDPRGSMLMSLGRPLQGRTFRVWNRLLGFYSWSVVVDVGANYGEMIVFSQISKESQIVVVEPNAQVFKCLKNNLKQFKNVTFLDCAVTGNIGKAYLDLDQGHSGKSKITPKSDGYEVDTITLDKVLEIIPYTTALIKIDIEGSEKDLIGSLLRLSNSGAHFFLETQSFSEKEFLPLLRDYRIFDIDSNSVPIFEIHVVNLSPYLRKAHKGRNCFLLPRNSKVPINIKELRPVVYFLLECAAAVRYNIKNRYFHI